MNKLPKNSPFYFTKEDDGYWLYMRTRPDEMGLDHSIIIFDKLPEMHMATQLLARFNDALLYYLEQNGLVKETNQ